MSEREFSIPAFERLTPDLTGPERLAVFLGLPVDMQTEAWADLGGRIEAQGRERFAEERLGGWATPQEIADEIATIWRDEVRHVPLGGVEPAKQRGVPRRPQGRAGVRRRRADGDQPDRLRADPHGPGDRPRRQGLLPVSRRRGRADTVASRLRRPGEGLVLLRVRARRDDHRSGCRAVWHRAARPGLPRHPAAAGQRAARRCVMTGLSDDQRRRLEAERARLLPPPSAPMEVARELVAEWYVERGPRTDASALARRLVGVAGAALGRDRAARRAGRRPTRSPRTPSTNRRQGQKPWAPNRHKIADLLDALAAIVHLPENVSMPAWLDGDRLRRPDRVGRKRAARRRPAATCCRMTRGSSTPPASRSTSTPTRSTPSAGSAFSRICGARIGTRSQALGEWFGYVISGRLDLHKILLIVGPTRAGKGVIARTLGKLVGDRERRRPDAVEPVGRLRARAAARQVAGGRLGRAAERSRRARRGGAAAVDLGRGHADRQPQVPRPVDREAAGAADAVLERAAAPG